MASIVDFLSTDSGKKFVEKAGEQVNESPAKVKSVLGIALPMLMGALKKNTDSPEGAEKLGTELEKEKHNGSILDKISELRSGAFLSEGSGILKHILGGSESGIATAISSATGMDTSKVQKILQMAAPVVMGILGKQKRKDNVEGGAGISKLVGSVLGSNSSHDQSMLETFLNAGSGGKVANEVAGKIFGSKGKSKGLGDFFKG